MNMLSGEQKLNILRLVLQGRMGDARELGERYTQENAKTQDEKE